MDLKQITQAHIYTGDDRQLRGVVEELELGEVGLTEVEHSSLGMVGVLNLPGRPVQAVGGTLTIRHMDEELERELLNPTRRHNWQLHQRVDVFDSAGYADAKSHVIVHQIGFHIMTRNAVTSRLGEGVMPAYQITVPYLRQFRDGDNTNILLLDVFADVYEVNGASVWAQ